MFKSTPFSRRETAQLLDLGVVADMFKSTPFSRRETKILELLPYRLVFKSTPFSRRETMTG